MSAGVAQQSAVGGGDQQIAVQETDEGRLVCQGRTGRRTDGHVRGGDRRRRDCQRYLRVM